MVTSNLYCYSINWTVPLLHTYFLTSTAIQFSFDTTTVTGDEAVAAGQAGGQTIFLPVMVNIEPPTALLQGDIIVGVTVTGGTATSKYHK